MKNSYKRSYFWLTLVALVAFLTSPIISYAQSPASISYEGILVLSEGPSICMQGRFQLNDCQGNLIIRLTENENGPDLDNQTGQYVRITGPNVGVECPVIQSDEVTMLTNACVSPSPQITSKREGILSVNTNGGFELRDCQGNVLWHLFYKPDNRIPNLGNFVGQFVHVKGGIHKTTNAINVRRITVKTNVCGQ
jgi:hypothetical protein